VLIFDEPRCTEIFLQVKPDIYVKGGDYNIDTINKEEKATLIRAGAEIAFIPFVPGFSTSEILGKLKLESKIK